MSDQPTAKEHIQAGEDILKRALAKQQISVPLDVLSVLVSRARRAERADESLIRLADAMMKSESTSEQPADKLTQFEVAAYNQAHNLQEHLTQSYLERAYLLAVLSKVYPATLFEDESAEETFRTCVAIIFPTGQATWHIHKDDLDLFQHLELNAFPFTWDGHSTNEKYNRLAQLPAIKFVYGTRDDGQPAILERIYFRSPSIKFAEAIGAKTTHDAERPTPRTIDFEDAKIRSAVEWFSLDPTAPITLTEPEAEPIPDSIEEALTESVDQEEEVSEPNAQPPTPSTEDFPAIVAAFVQQYLSLIHI